MKLKSLINNAQNSPMAKTASAQAAAPAKASAVGEAINEALAKAETTKVAAEVASPTADLEKMAAAVVESQHASEVAHVQKLGAAMADAYVRQLASYEQAAAQLAQEKTASMGITDGELQLISELRADPQGTVMKLASMVGVAPQDEYLTEKQAAEVWQQTAEATVRGIHKTAMEHYATGYQTVLEVLGG
jgi:hypothetical protein